MSAASFRMMREQEEKNAKAVQVVKETPAPAVKPKPARSKRAK